MSYGSQVAAANSPMTRIESDIETMKRFRLRLDDIHDRIIRNARAMGYYEPPPANLPNASTPLTTTMTEAMRDIDLAIDRINGVLNVFD